MPDSPRGVDSGAAADSLYVMQRLGGNALVVRRGFRVAVFADELDGVRMMARGPDGAVYASLSRLGRVVALPDADADGRADRVRPVVDGLRGPHGLAFRGDTLYIAEEHRVIRLVPPDDRLEVVVDGLPTGGNHTSRTIHLLDDTLLVSIGSSCNLCDERDPRRAAIVRYDLDGSGESLYATGLRNAVGLARDPVTGALWATNNDRDRLGDDLPPDRVNVIASGGWYGWPQCYLPGTPNPEYAETATRCGEAIGPIVTFPAHSAPLGLAFYTGARFPEEFRGDLYVALHGSWDRSFPTGYKVVRVPLNDGEPAGEPEDFVAGWQVGRRWWGRPVDVIVAPDGALLISDDFADQIYRVWWIGDQPAP
ncbi:MAG: PQQ-dependent sugar dehydrogenase [Gemmatimonadota bacterium]|nr:PQQ-dependent sugar dehydrogenase [Gemmatimonadota bacterium]